MKTVIHFIALLAGVLGAVAGNIPVSKPSYRAILDLAQYSMLNHALADGMRGHPDGIALELRVRSRAREVEWEVGFATAEVIRACQGWVATSALKEIQAVDWSNLSEGQRLDLDAFKRLGASLEQALAHPIWPEREFRGLLSQANGRFLLETEAGPLRIVGPAAKGAGLTNGATVIAQGFVKSEGQLEAVRVRPRPVGTLEIFTMSQCPFGNAAIGTILTHLENLPPSQRPIFRLRFIFYPFTEDGANIRYRSLHGPAEQQENLVQLTLQRDHPEIMPNYLRHRLRHPNLDWRRVAEQAGLAPAERERVEVALGGDPMGLLMDEYHYVAQLCGVLDGSPRFFWEGSEVLRLSQIPIFASLADQALPQEHCAK